MKTDNHLQQTNGELVEIAPYVKGTVITQTALKAKVSTRTVDTYLKGEGKKLPTAIAILKAAKSFATIQS